MYQVKREASIYSGLFFVQNSKINQLNKILTVQNAIKNGQDNFSFINEIDEVPLAEREIIIRATEDLTERVVRGFMPRMDVIVSDFAKMMTGNKASYAVNSCDLWKYGDEIGMVAGDLANKQLISSLGTFSLDVMEKFSSSWKKVYPALNLHFKGITNELNKVQALFAFHDVVLTLEFKVGLKDDNATYSIALPYSVVKTIDKIS